MLVKPAVTDLLKKVDNRYSLIIMTAKRARQIADGANPMVNNEDKSPVTIAVNEIYQDKVYEINDEDTEDAENKE